MKKIKIILILLCVTSIKIHSQTAQEYFKNGTTKYKNGDYVGAIEEYSKAIKIDSLVAVTYYNRANAKSIIDNNKEAILDYNKAIELDPYILLLL